MMQVKRACSTTYGIVGELMPDCTVLALKLAAASIAAESRDALCLSIAAVACQTRSRPFLLPDICCGGDTGLRGWRAQDPQASLLSCG